MFPSVSSVLISCRAALPPTCAALVLASGLTHAASLPLWEASIGLVGIVVPDYRGADSTTSYLLPTPYFVYRGEFVAADRGSVRGLRYKSEKGESNLSVNGTLPISSDNNAARQGMESLRPVVEVGPSVNATVWRSADEKQHLSLRAPLRAALTVESSPRHTGWLLSPNLLLEVHDPAGFGGWRLGMQAGPIFQSRRYNNFFYTVTAVDATASRPTYQPSGGYEGSQFTLTLTKRYPRWWVGSFVRVDQLSGASFNDSPLVKQCSAVAAGLAMAWVFGESSTRLEAED
jgi:outer membrane scaffolding protein for murein synthesis (MipA/OmpV family)